MKTSDWIALAALIVAALAAVGSLIGFLMNRGAVARAELKAERAASAAERSALAQERMARVAELEQVREANESPSPKVVWHLSHHSGNAYILENVGTGTAYDVTVSKVDPNLWVDGPPSSAADVLQPHEAATFHAFLNLAVADDRILVTWADEPDGTPRHEWRRSLPPT